MITPDFVERSSRKTLTLSVLKDGRVVVKAPLKMRDEVISDFVESKQEWIKEKLLLVSQTRLKFEDVVHYKKFLLYGNRYTLLLDNVKKTETNDKFQIVMPIKTEREKILKNLKLWYKKVAKQVLQDRLSYIESKIKIKSNSFKIGDSQGRWGACNSKGSICLNFRVIMLPPPLIDYVLVHELCHLVEMNHSKNFWKLVSTFLPDYENRKYAIKEYSFLLSLFDNV